jgi:hypothetical protein
VWVIQLLEQETCQLGLQIIQPPNHSLTLFRVHLLHFDKMFKTILEQGRRLGAFPSLV